MECCIKEGIINQAVSILKKRIISIYYCRIRQLNLSSHYLFIDTVTVESPLRGHYQDQKKCPLDRGDNYKDFERFTSWDQEKCPLDRGVPLTEVITMKIIIMTILVAGNRTNVPLMELITAKVL